MNIFLKILAMFLVLLIAPVAWAGASNFGPIEVDQLEASDTYIFRGENSSGTQKIEVDTSGNIDAEGTLDVAGGNFTIDSSGNITASGGGTPYGYVQLPMTSFFIPNTGVAPGYNIYQAPKDGVRMNWDPVSPALEWGHRAGISPALSIFKVPANYSSGGSFFFDMVAYAGKAPKAGTSMARMDYEVYVNSDGSVPGNYIRYDTPMPNLIAWNQTPVSFTETPGKHELIELAPTSPSLSAGDIVTLKIWGAAGNVHKVKLHNGYFRFIQKY